MVDSVSPEEREALFTASRDHRMMYSTANEFTISWKCRRNRLSLWIFYHSGSSLLPAFRTVCRDWTGTQDARIGASSLYPVIALPQEWFDDDNVVD
jgi:hypothetical protein